MGNQLITDSNGTMQPQKHLLQERSSLLRAAIRDHIHNRVDDNITKVGSIKRNTNIDLSADNSKLNDWNKSSNKTLNEYIPAQFQPDYMSSQHIYPESNNPMNVKVNQMKAFCYKEQPIIQQADNQTNFLSIAFPSPLIDLSGSLTSYVPGKTKTLVEQASMKSYNINDLPKMKLEELQKLAKDNGIKTTIDSTKSGEKPITKKADALIDELKRNKYPNLLEVVYVGYQLKKEETEQLNKNFGGIKSGSNAAKGGGVQTLCDKFMTHQCAKQINEQGCLQYKMTYTKDGTPLKRVPGWNSKSSQCFDVKGRPWRGMPECACLNSTYGTSMNTKPTNLADNPYGLNCKKVLQAVEKGVNGTAEEKDVALRCSNPKDVKDQSVNSTSNYTLNVYGITDLNQQLPHLTDPICQQCQSTSNNDTGNGSAYTTSRMTDKQTSITLCINNLSIGDSDIGSLQMQDIKQTNNCGGGGGGDASKNDLMTDDEKAALKLDEKKSKDMLTDVQKFGNNAIEANNLLTKSVKSLEDITADIANYTGKLDDSLASAKDFITASQSMDNSNDLNLMVKNIKSVQGDIDSVLDKYKTAKTSVGTMQKKLQDGKPLLIDAIGKIKDIKAKHKLLTDVYRQGDPSSDIIMSNEKYIIDLADTNASDEKLAKFNTDSKDILDKFDIILKTYETYNANRKTAGSAGLSTYKSALIDQVVALYNKQLAIEKGQKASKPPESDISKISNLAKKQDVKFADDNTVESKPTGNLESVAKSPDTIKQSDVPINREVTDKSDAPKKLDNIKDKLTQGAEKVAKESGLVFDNLQSKRRDITEIVHEGNVIAKKEIQGSNTMIYIIGGVALLALIWFLFLRAPVQPMPMQQQGMQQQGMQQMPMQQMPIQQPIR